MSPAKSLTSVQADSLPLSLYWETLVIKPVRKTNRLIVPKFSLTQHLCASLSLLLKHSNTMGGVIEVIDILYLSTHVSQEPEG